MDDDMIFSDKLNITHAYVMSKLYDEYSATGKPVVFQLEDGNDSHYYTINKLADLGYIHIRPHRNDILTFLTDEGVALMRSVDKIKEHLR